jgi:hypothetical protein
MDTMTRAGSHLARHPFYRATTTEWRSKPARAFWVPTRNAYSMEQMDATETPAGARYAYGALPRLRHLRDSVPGECLPGRTGPT